MPNLISNVNKCQAARDFVERYLQSKGVSVSAQQMERVVQECCDDPSSKSCMEAVASLAASELCDYYTGNACEPCCTYAGNLIAPYVVGALWKAGGSIEEGWDLVSAIWESVTGPGSCDYSGAANKLVAKYSEAALDVSNSMERSFRAAMDDLDIPEPAWRKSLHAPIKNGKVCSWSENGFEQVPWLHLLLARATSSRRSYKGADGIRRQTSEAGSLLITADSSSGSMTFPDLRSNPPTTTDSYFYFKWAHWSCNQHWADKFGNAAASGLQRRWEGVEDALSSIENEVTSAVAMEAQGRKSVEWIVRRVKFEEQSDDSSNTLLAIATLAALVGGGYWLWTRKS